MKKLLLLLALVGTIFSACEGGGDVEEENGVSSKIELAKQSIEVEFEPAEYSVNVTSPCSWKAASDDDWIVVETKSGIAGTKTLKFSVTRNDEEEIREGTITLKNTDYNLIAELYVTQKSFVPELTISPETLNFAVEGGTQEVAITANFGYEVKYDADWLTIEKNENGISVTVPNYVEVDERTAEITISNEEYGVSKVVKVSQGAFVPKWIIPSETLNYTWAGGSKKVVIPANIDYAYSANVDWISLEKTTNGISVEVLVNTSFESRSAEITVSNEKYGLSKNIRIQQEAAINGILYTSSDGEVVKPYKTNVFGANIVSNAYNNGQGIIIFDAPVTSIGEKAFYGIEDGWELNDCDRLTSITIPNSVTSIGDCAFDDCSSLKSITIPDGVTSIGEYAFWGCSSLTRVNISDLSAWCKIDFASSSANPLHNKAKLYLNNTEASDLVIPSDITEIKDVVFYNCSSLTSVTIPNSVTSIGNSAFYDCDSLTSVTIGNSVTSIGISAFYDCSSLISVTIPDGVTSIGEYAFYDCSSLTSVTIPNSVTSIGEYAFYDCSSLISVTIPNSVTSIGEYAFYDCSSLISVTIPDGVTSIRDYTFYNCSSLTSITIPDSVTSIGQYAFENCTGELIIDSNELGLYGGQFTKLTIGNSVTSIGDYAFRGCNSLTSVTIPNSVTSIGQYAFYYCDGLTSVIIGNSVTSIGRYAFYDCDSLTSVTIPNSVTSIDICAFKGCSSLTSVYCKATTPPIGGYGMFDYLPEDLNIYVPTASVDAYKAKSYWSDYASDIVGYDF